MPKLYRYVGPPGFARQASPNSPRCRVALHGEEGKALAEWIAKNAERDGTLIATFVVLPGGVWVADRRSEHVACARGASVLSAGEMTFALDRRRGSIEVVHVTNQSTGYCPQPESWPAVASALDAAGIAHPGAFDLALIFRRCTKCDTTNIVKEDVYECFVCGAPLPREWNY